jgi:hypothetical protein
LRRSQRRGTSTSRITTSSGATSWRLATCSSAHADALAAWNQTAGSLPRA